MPNTTNAPGRALLVICFTSGLWAFGTGVGLSLAPLWLKRAGSSDTLIGFNTATYYAGLALAAFAVPAMMRLMGAAASVWGMAITGIAVALFPFGDTNQWWFALRLLCGMAGAFSLIPMETYVNRDLAPEHRARNFGLYTVALVVGWALGNWVSLDLVTKAPRTAFLIGGAASCLAALVVHGYLPPIRARIEKKSEGATINLRDNLLSFGSAWCQGFLEGGLMTFLSLYLIGQGLSEHHTGWLVSLSMIGMVAFQLPVTWLGDYFGRQAVLLVCYGCVAIGLVVVPLAGTSLLLPVALVAVVACAGAFYPLGLALLGENLPADQLDRGNALYLAVEGLGCLMGPVLMGMANDRTGATAMFVVGEAAVLLALAFWIIGRHKDAPMALPVNQSPAPRQAA